MATSASPPHSSIRCQSVISFFSALFSIYVSEVAILNDTTVSPLGRVRLSGLAPRLPIRFTLLRDGIFVLFRMLQHTYFFSHSPIFFWAACTAAIVCVVEGISVSCRIFWSVENSLTNFFKAASRSSTFFNPSSV